MESEFYSDSAYTADISTKMRVPDRLLLHNGHAEQEQNWGDQHGYSVSSMMVPDRILVAGSDQHIPSKSTPRELQLENSVIPPTPEHVRVQTPPRSIKLGEVMFPTVQDEPFCPTPMEYRRSIKLEDVAFPSAGEAAQPNSPPKYFSKSKNGYKADRSVGYEQDHSMSLQSDSSISLYDEVQRMRTQMAKLNHRLMAVELENQQHNQRWQVCSVLVSAYFLVKALAWLNRN